MSEPSTELAVVSVPAGSPLPAFSGPEMAAALVAYRELQVTLDRSMPDQIMAIGDKQFRKKGYWRAIAVAFNLTVEPTEERREEQGTFEDGHPNFGYLVTCRASTPSGRAATGDGSCFAVEKAPRFRCPHPEPGRPGRTVHYPGESCPDFDPMFAWRALPAQATEHNIRSHAHTRAYNRAVSNLCGFGEVSAEEIYETSAPQPAAFSEAPGPSEGQLPIPPAARPATARTTGGELLISEAQQKRLYAIGKTARLSDDLINEFVRRAGYGHMREIPRRVYDRLCSEISTFQ